MLKLESPGFTVIKRFKKKIYVAKTPLQKRKKKVDNNQYKVKALEAEVALTTSDEKEFMCSKILETVINL